MVGTGTGWEIRQPLGYAIVGGLAVATLATGMAVWAAACAAYIVACFRLG
jgi:multidrug efflux pump subunit AcrB